MVSDLRWCRQVAITSRLIWNKPLLTFLTIGLWVGCSIILINPLSQARPSIIVGTTELAKTVENKFPGLAVYFKNNNVFTPSHRLLEGKNISGWKAQAILMPPERAKPVEKTAWLETAQRNGNKAAGLDLFFPQYYSEVFTVGKDGAEVKISSLNATRVKGELNQNSLVYREVYPATDSLHLVNSNGSKEFLYLRDKVAPKRFEYRLSLGSGVSAGLNAEGAVWLSGEKGQSFKIDSPWFLDGYGTKHNTQDKVRWELAGEGKELRLSLIIKPEGFNYPLVIDPSFSANSGNGNLTTARGVHTATLLPNGKVLIIGGSLSLSGPPTNSVELYDPATNTFTANSGSGNLNNARFGHTATLLPNGNVLVTGGLGVPANVLNSVELYNPTTNTFTANTGSGNLTTLRGYHTATLLSTGKVIIIGGQVTNAGPATNSVELYEPTTNTFTPNIGSGNLTVARNSHTATLLPNGKVLVTGGAATNIVELYDPTTNTFSTNTGTGNLTTPRSSHSATLLSNGKVLIVGGNLTGSSVEVYDPTTNSFTANTSSGNLTSSRFNHTATLLPNDKVLITGGTNLNGITLQYLSSVEVYDPATNTFTVNTGNGNLAIGRAYHTAILLATGKVIIAGGAGSNITTLASSELYDYAANPNTGTFTANSGSGNLTVAVTAHTATLLPNGKVLVAGGGGNTGPPVDNVEIYDPATNTFTVNTGSSKLNSPRQWHTATLLPNGKVLIAGGVGLMGGGINTTELYDFNSNTFSSAGNLNFARKMHTATLLTDGKVLIVGGRHVLSIGINEVEIYDPVTNTFSVNSGSGNLTTGRYLHTATLLSNGKVLVAGGFDALNTVEIYDPATNTFSANSGSGNLTSSRFNHTATLLPNGKVLIVGGGGTTVELYDPVTNSFTTNSGSGNLTTNRDNHSATMLRNGKVLIVAGLVASAPINSVEIYDSATNTFTANSGSGNVTTARDGHTATLLPDGKVLVVAGENSLTSLTNSVEVYDEGLSISSANQPTINNLASSINVNNSLSISGTLFSGRSEASGGGYSTSAGNYPILQIMSLENEQIYYTPVTSWTPLAPGDTAISSFTVAPIGSFPLGYARITVFVNGIPSFAKISKLQSPPLEITTQPVNQTVVVGQEANFSVSAVGGKGIYSYQWYRDGNIIGSSIGASLNLTPTLAGSSNISVTVSSLTESVSSNTVILTVNKANTNTSLTASANPSVLGQSVTFTATVGVVAPGSGNPSGIVQFYRNGSPFGTAQSLSGGVVSLVTNTLPLGSHLITATYSGSADFLNSNSTNYTQTVISRTSNLNNFGTVKLLDNTVRIASTQPGDGLNSPKLTATGNTPSAGTSSSTVELTIGGTNNIPFNAVGIFGILTNVGCTGGGNFRFFVGNSVPNAATLNVPGANPALNLSTNFIAPLEGGKLKLGLGSGAVVTCGYVVDVAGYITLPEANSDRITLLPNTVRVASTQAFDGLNSPKLTATGTVPTVDVSSSTVELNIGATFGILANVKGVIGVLTNVGCSGGGNFRFFSGTTIPNSANLNVPGALSSLNLSTGFIAALDSNGKIKLGLGSGANVTCGYVMDVTGYITAPNTGNNLTLLSNNVRVASTQVNDLLNSAKLTAANGIAPSINVSSSTAEFTIGGNFGIPAGAKGIFGVLTNIGCNSGGNLRFWAESVVPNAASLNIPGAFPALNLSTGFSSGLNAGGKVKLGLGSGVPATCGYVTDVIAYLS